MNTKLKTRPKIEDFLNWETKIAEKIRETNITDQELKRGQDCNLAHFLLLKKKTA